MNIVQPRTTRQLPLEQPPPNATLVQRSQTWLRSPLWLCVFVALLARIWLIYHAHGLIDGDEAQVGIQALRILKGEHPVYFYGSPYTGSLTAYLIAPFFALFGVTDATLRSIPLLFSLLLVCLTWLLAGALGDSARLLPGARRRFQTIAALIAALPPLYNGAVEMRAWGNSIEVFLCSLLLFYWSVRLTLRWREGMGLGESIWRWAGIGVVVGVGYWLNPIMEVSLLVCALWLIGSSILKLFTARRQEYDPRTLLRSLGQSWLTAIYAIPAALIGFAPAILWGYRHHWENFKYILHPERSPNLYDPYMRSDYIANVGTITSATKNYLTCDLPRVLSGQTPNTPPQQESVLTQLLHPQSMSAIAYDVVLITMLVCIVAALILFLLSFFVRSTRFVRKLLSQPLLIGAGVSMVFCLSDLTLHPQIQYNCDADLTGRYAALLVLALPFLVGAVFTLISMGGEQANIRQQYLSTANGHPVRQSSNQRPRFSLTSFVVSSILIIMLVGYASTQFIAYASAPETSYFRSPSCRVSLVQTEAVIDYLQKEQIRYVWSAHWIGNILMFRTKTNVVATDPRIFTDPTLVKSRFPEYTTSVSQAENASLVFLMKSSDSLPDKLKTLDAGQIKYNAERFTVDQGVDLVVVTPVDYTLQQTEASALVTNDLLC